MGFSSTMAKARISTAKAVNSVTSPIKEELIKNCEANASRNIVINASEGALLTTAAVIGGGLFVGVIPTGIALGAYGAIKERAAYKAGQRSIR